MDFIEGTLRVFVVSDEFFYSSFSFFFFFFFVFVLLSFLFLFFYFIFISTPIEPLKAEKDKIDPDENGLK